jgi:hypothetical protein
MSMRNVKNKKSLIQKWKGNQIVDVTTDGFMFWLIRSNGKRSVCSKADYDKFHDPVIHSESFFYQCGSGSVGCN